MHTQWHNVYFECQQQSSICQLYAHIWKYSRSSVSAGSAFMNQFFFSSPFIIFLNFTSILNILCFIVRVSFQVIKRKLSKCWNKENVMLMPARILCRELHSCLGVWPLDKSQFECISILTEERQSIKLCTVICTQHSTEYNIRSQRFILKTSYNIHFQTSLDQCIWTLDINAIGRDSITRNLTLKLYSSIYLALTLYSVL